MITMALISSCNWKALVPFYLQKKIPENGFLTLIIKLSQNRTEKQIIPFKTTLNWLFNDIWCFLVIGSFD